MIEVGLRLNGEEVLTARVFEKDQAKQAAINAVDVFLAHVLSDTEDQEEAIKWLQSLVYSYTIREISEPSKQIILGDLCIKKRITEAGKEMILNAEH